MKHIYSSKNSVQVIPLPGTQGRRSSPAYRLKVDHFANQVFILVDFRLN